MAGPSAAQDEWVSRVLGVALPGSPPGRSLLMPTWLRTREAIDEQVAAMQQALRSYGDEDYETIAELGFNGLTGGRNTALMAALLDHDRAPSAEARSRVADAVESYAGLLSPDSVLDDYDANPLGVSVSFRATLERGLDALRHATAGTEGPDR